MRDLNYDIHCFGDVEDVHEHSILKINKVVGGGFESAFEK